MAVLVLWSLASPAHAVSYAPVSDPDLYDASELIVSGTVRQRGPDPNQPLEATAYQFEVEAQYKGVTQTEALSFQIPGADNPAASGALVIAGAPQLAAGEHALLFLRRNSRGAWEPVHLGLGLFRSVMGNDGQTLWINDVAGSRNRDATRFQSWLQQAAAPASTVAGDYWTTAVPVVAPATKYLLAEVLPIFWTEFQRGEAVTFYASTTAVTDLPGGGYNEFQQALAAWNNDADTAINLVYGGTASPGRGLLQADGLNQILFEDPNNEIAGRFDCANGGVAAMTKWRTNILSSLGYQAINETDIVIQDGAGCLLKDNNTASELFAHELGHALGLWHSCGDSRSGTCVPFSAADEAVMRTSTHGDGRGAALGLDDINGIKSIYQHAPNSQITPEPPVSEDTGGGAFMGHALAILMLLINALRRATSASYQ